jgi:hypothetical protein
LDQQIDAMKAQAEALRGANETQQRAVQQQRALADAQIAALREQAAAVERGNRVSQQAAEVNLAVQRASQRAYVVVESARLLASGNPVHNLNFEGVLKNAGVTPASNIRLHVTCGSLVGDQIRYEEKAYLPWPRTWSVSELAPRGEISFRVNGSVPPAEAFSTRLGQAVCFAGLEYADAFNNSHFNAFCLTQLPTENLLAETGTCPASYGTNPFSRSKRSALRD